MTTEKQTRLRYTTPKQAGLHTLKVGGVQNASLF